MLRNLFCAMVAVALLTALLTRPADAQQQEQFYIQVEARTSLSAAQDSVRTFTGRFPNVAGFALGGGWYGIALGPYDSRGDAEGFLNSLLRSGAVPPDSYVETSRLYGQQFWPVGAGVPVAEPAPQTTQGDGAQTAQTQTTTQDTTDQANAALGAAPAAPAAPAPETTQDTAQAPTVAPPAAPQPAAAPEEPDETPNQARASERLLTRAQRDELQIALQWAGFYRGAIDGAYGRGTRGAMAQWQEANGYEATGVLTTRQRAALLGQYNAVLEGMDLRTVTDGRAGIQMEMPLGVVAFDRYEAPFALFSPTGALDARVLLISQPGDRTTLNGLYEIMQTLEIVPLEGDRQRTRDGFVLTGANSRIVSHTEVSLQGGQIKGFTLIWPAGDEERRTRVLDIMEESFTRIGGVLDPAAVTDEGQAVDLVSGLRVRKPKGNGSGFFVDTRGTVLTSSETVAQCERVTLNGIHEARVVASDAALGVSVLRPVEALAPRRIAQFNPGTQRLPPEVAVAGFSFGGVLTAPTLTFGTLEDVRGLAGEDTVKRLALAVLPGDVGGPVFDAGGTVMGMLLPRESAQGRVLPEQVNFAAKGDLILNFLRGAGVDPSARTAATVLAPEDLTALATDMTVLVSCW